MTKATDWNFTDSTEVDGRKIRWQFTNGYLTVTVVRVGEATLRHAWKDWIPRESVGTLEEMKERVQSMALEIAEDMVANPWVLRKSYQLRSDR